MNTSLFHHYYEEQINHMETNPTLRTQLAEQLRQTKPSHRLRNWLMVVSSATAIIGAMAGLVLYLQPKPVTADTLLRTALSTPELRAGQIYRTNSTMTSTDFDVANQVPTDTITKQTTISDGINLERLTYDDKHQLIGAELYVPQTSDRSVYDVYEYGSLKDFRGVVTETELIQHRVVYNVDTRDDIDATRPDTFTQLPDSFAEELGRTSVLELVAGSSVWRPYATNDIKKTAFFVEPTITETTFNQTAAYQLDVKMDGIEMIGWISKEDGRLLADQSIPVTDDSVIQSGLEPYPLGVTTVYESPVMMTGTMPQSVAAFAESLGLSSAAVQELTVDDTFGSDYLLPGDDLLDLPGCGGTEPLPAELDGMCGL